MPRNGLRAIRAAVLIAVTAALGGFFTLGSVLMVWLSHDSLKSAGIDVLTVLGLSRATSNEIENWRDGFGPLTLGMAAILLVGSGAFLRVCAPHAARWKPIGLYAAGFFGALALGIWIDIFDSVFTSSWNRPMPAAWAEYNVHMVGFDQVLLAAAVAILLGWPLGGILRRSLNARHGRRWRKRRARLRARRSPVGFPKYAHP